MADQVAEKQEQAVSERLVGLPEVPVSVNFYCVDQAGFNYQWTLRDTDEMALVKRVAVFKDWLLKHGVVPKQVGQQPQGQQGQQSQAAAGNMPPVKGEKSERAMQLTPPVAAGNGSGALNFQAESMVGSVQDGQQYWKIKGGKFSKYGVTVWPEVLEAAGFDVDALNIGQRYTMQGYTAYYSMNSEGKPHKVTELVRS